MKSWLEAFVGLFYPNVCQICGEERSAPEEGFVGARCRQQAGAVRRIEPPFCERCGLPFGGAISGSFVCANCRGWELHLAWARAAVVANPFILDIIHRYKYRRALWFEPFLGGLLVEAAAASVVQGGWEMIVPVPLHPVRRREREFNQAQRLAAYLGRATQIPVNNRLLRRVQPTLTQTKLTRTDRRQNVRSAFALRSGKHLEVARFIVVDDVLTTGATTDACAAALLDAGAEEVGVWTVARGI